jgi:hypothetical protein
MLIWIEVVCTKHGQHATLQVFVDILCYNFNITFPCKSVHVSKSYSNKWITQGIKISRKIMVFFKTLKKIWGGSTDYNDDDYDDDNDDDNDDGDKTEVGF